VLGLADSFGLAFFKSQEAVQASLPLEGNILITVADRDKKAILEAARKFYQLGFTILATKGTREFLQNQGIECRLVRKIQEVRPNIMDIMKNGEVGLIINTPAGKQSETDDSFIRKNAIKYRIPYITTTAAALAAAIGIAVRREGNYTVKSLQEYHQAVLL